MRYSHIFSLILLICFSCQYDHQPNNILGYNLPSGAKLSLTADDISNPRQLQNALKLFGFEEHLNYKLLNAADSLGLENLSLGFYSKNDQDFMIISGKTPSFHDTGSETFPTNLKTHHLTKPINNSAYMRSVGEEVLISIDSAFLSSVQPKNNQFIETLNKVDRRQTGLNIVSKRSLTTIPLSQIKTKEDDTLRLNDNLYLNIQSNAQKLTFSGLITSDSLSLKSLKKPNTSQLLDFIPSSATHWQILNLKSDDSNETEATNFNPSTSPTFDFPSLSSEIATLGIQSDTLLVFNTRSTMLLKQQLELLKFVESFKEFDIYSYEWDSSKTQDNTALLNAISSQYLVVIDNFLVLSNSLNPLKYCINSYLNKTTVAQSESFKALSPDLRSAFSYMSYGNQTTLDNLIPDLDPPYNSSYFQLSLDNKFIHINGVLAHYKKIKNAAPVEEFKLVSFDRDILFPPQLVKNHLNGQMDILIQDVGNNLYLISNKGKIYWKKRINEPILGTVEQIDMYKNGRLQLAFCTRSNLYVLDRNGKDVNPFPKHFNDPITQPLAVFDYDNKRNYRLLITQGNELLMLDAKGKRVSGFKYNTSKGITSKPQHFRIKRKDYIVFKAGDRLKILNRRGQDRLNIKEKVSFSNNKIYLYQSQFTTTSSNGDLIQVDTKGTLRRQSLNLPDDHQMTCTNKTLVTQTENALNIKLKSVDLDYGIYSDPEIFYLRDKIYITTTDLQSNKVYLFDSQAKAVKGFPIFGNSKAIMANLDNSRELEMVVQTDSKNISILRLQ